MPFIKDHEMETDWEYEPVARAVLDEEPLDKWSGIYLAALRRLGAEQLHIRYDGGEDEGFAHFTAATVDGERLGVGELKDRLVLDEDDPSGNVAMRFEDLAICLAIQLLSKDFGVGPISVKGRFVVDLTSGAMVDEETER